jgi:hypothetical protein
MPVKVLLVSMCLPSDFQAKIDNNNNSSVKRQVKHSTSVFNKKYRKVLQNRKKKFLEFCNIYLT